MKKLTAVLILLGLFICTLNAQPPGPTSNVLVASTGSPFNDNNYATLSEAFDAINSGLHTDGVTIYILSSTVESTTAALYESGISFANYSTIDIVPSGGDGKKTISGDIAGALVNLDGADFVHIDGVNLGGDSLAFINTNTSANASTFQFSNDATNNYIRNCNILGSSTGVATGTIFLDVASILGNSFNEFSNNIISSNDGFPATNAFYSSGSPLANNYGNVIDNCNFSDYFNAVQPSNGILIDNYNSTWTITSNKFYQSSAITYTAGNDHAAIKVKSNGLNEISNNIIGYASDSQTGTYTMDGWVSSRFFGIQFEGEIGLTSSIQGNLISAISLNTTNNTTESAGVGVFSGINIIEGSVSVGDVSPNIIGGVSGTDLIIVTTTVTDALTTGINIASTGTVNIQSNSIGGISAPGRFSTTSSALVGFNISGAASELYVTNNTVGNASAHNFKAGISGSTTGSTKVVGIRLSGDPTSSIFSNNTIQNITAFGAGAAGYARGFTTTVGSTATTTNPILVSSNTVRNITSNSALTLVGNGRSGTVGINISNGDNCVINDNRISDIANINTMIDGSYVVGISVGNASNVNIYKNYISALRNAGRSTKIYEPSVAAGILIRSGKNNISIYNNMISLGSAQTTNTSFVGIQSNNGFTPNPSIQKIYFNSVNIEGTASVGGQPSFGYLRGDFSTTARNVTVDLKNNIFSNNRTGGTGRHFAIGNNYGVAASATGWSSNYNDLDAAASTIGYWNAALDSVNWRTTSGNDANSLFVPPVFVSATNLHLQNSSTLFKKGFNITGFFDDIDGETRQTPPAIGADDKAIVLPVTIQYLNGYRERNVHQLSWKVSCNNSQSVNISLERSNNGRNFSGIYSLSASSTRCLQSFNYTDLQPLSGINYYRLKMVDADRSVSYSQQIAILNKTEGFEIIHLSPNPIINGKTSLTVSTTKEMLLPIIITDKSGRIVQRQLFKLTNGNNVLNIEASQLAVGSYQITCFPESGTKQSIGFIKL